jgi:outer membrane protein
MQGLQASLRHGPVCDNQVQQRVKMIGKISELLVRIRIVLLIVCFSVCHAQAQVTFRSLEEVWKYAEEHNIQINIASSSNKIAALSVKQAVGNMMPAVAINGTFTDNVKIPPTLVPANLLNPKAAEGTFTEATFGRRFNYNANATAQFDILNIQDWFNLRKATLDEKIAGANYARAKQQLYEQVATAYYSCLLLRKATDLSINNDTSAISICKVATEKYKNGLISQVVLNIALINKEKADKTVNIALRDYAVQSNNLRLLLNCPDSIVLTQENDETQVNDMADLAVDPSVTLAYMQTLSMKNQWRSAKAAFAPTLSAFYQYNEQLVSDEILNFSNSNTIQQQYWGVKLSLPLFSGNTRHYQVKKTMVEYQLKQKEFENMQLESDLRDKNLITEYTSAFKVLAISKNMLAKYEENDRHAEQLMNEGMMSLEDRLRYYTDLINDQNEYLQSMSDLFINSYKIQIRKTNFQTK